MIKVLSLFNGISCARMAIEQVMPIKVFYCEIDKWANKVTQTLYPNDTALGNVVNLDISNLGDVDLIIGGPPCQSFSLAGSKKGMKKGLVEITTLEKYEKIQGPETQSCVFWEFVKIIKGIQKLNPNVKFICENVKMANKWKTVITNALGVEPILINSKLVSAQDRKRLYWCNFPVDQPQDAQISFSSILEDGFTERDKSLVVLAHVGSATKERYINMKIHQMVCLEKPVNSLENYSFRKLYPIECMKLQTIPKDKISEILSLGFSKSRLFILIGNAFTVNVIMHIFKSYLKTKKFL